MDYLKPLFGTALTHVHVGVGRSPGTVDLPVVKDPFGVYYLPGSSVKGSMKTAATKKEKCKIVEGKIKCDECKEVCCVFGGEEGGETSRIVVSDMYPLFVPIPSLDEGFVFVTSNLLVSKSLSLLRATSESELSETLSELTNGERSDIHIGIEKMEAKRVDLPQKLKKVISTLNPMYSLMDHVYVIDDSVISLILERSLVRLTRVKLDRESKTVKTGALWTEEYVPHGTLFLGIIGDRGWFNSYCKESNVKNAIEKALDMLGANNGEFSLILGGKETVGKGLMKLKVI